MGLCFKDGRTFKRRRLEAIQLRKIQSQLKLAKIFSL
jgi:hypothetical protein